MQNPNPNLGQNPTPQNYQNLPAKSGGGCGWLAGCMIGCFGFFVVAFIGLAIFIYTFDFKSMFLNKLNNPEVASFIYKTVRDLDLIDKFLPEHLSEGEKLKVRDQLDKAMQCYGKMSDSDKKLIFELAKKENNANLDANQIQTLLQSVQQQCGLNFEDLQKMQGNLK